MPRPRPLTAAYAAVLAGGYALVFVAPWRSPATPAPAVSDSYMLGFDNRVAMLGALLVCAALLALGWPRRGAAGPLVLDHAPPREERVPRLLVAALLALSAATAVTFAWLALRTYGYGEKNYFLDRLAYMIAGFTPYRDVEFTYGPALILLPAWAARLLRPFGVGPAEAYSVTWIASFLAGVPLLAYCVNRLAMSRRQRGMLFAAVGIVVSFNETVGMNGLLLRFLMPAAALIALHGAATRALARPPGRRAPLLAGAVALAVAAGALVSPEVAIAVTAGAAVYLAALAFRDRSALAGAAGLAAVPLAAWALAGPGAARHLVGMAGGALNFPVVPGPPVVALLAGAWIAASLLPRHLGRGDGGAPAALALAAAGGTMLLGALGRADSSHAYFYGLTIALLAGATLASRAPRAFGVYAVAFAAVFLAAHLVILRGDYAGAIVGAAAGQQGVSEPAFRAVAGALTDDPTAALALRQRVRRPSDPDPDPRPFARYAPLAAPYGFRDGVGLALAERGWLAPAYFRATPFTPAQVAQHIASLEPARHLIVPAAFAAAIETTPPARPGSAYLGGERYGELLMWPERFPVRRRQPDIGGELRGWIARRYHRVAVVGGYTVLERKE